MDLPTVSRNECGVFISDSVFAPERAATDFHTRNVNSEEVSVPHPGE